jgi:hypothetical protein
MWSEMGMPLSRDDVRAFYDRAGISHIEAETSALCRMSARFAGAASTLYLWLRRANVRAILPKTIRICTDGNLRLHTSRINVGEVLVEG